jgi:hypothetical protein
VDHAVIAFGTGCAQFTDLDRDTAHPTMFVIGVEVADVTLVGDGWVGDAGPAAHDWVFSFGGSGGVIMCRMALCSLTIRRANAAVRQLATKVVVGCVRV